MRKSVIPFLFFHACAFGAPDYREQFYEQLSQRDDSGMEKTLKDWKGASPDDVEIGVASGNYYYNKSERSGKSDLFQSEPREKIVEVYHAALGPEVPPRRLIGWDRALMVQAVNYWKQALEQCPWRLDLYFKLAQLYQDTGDFESQYSILAKGLLYADKNRKNLKWIDNEDLPENRKEFIPKCIQTYAGYYLGQGQPEGDEKALRLEKLTITFYPGYGYAYNAMAACYSYRPDWERTLKYLLIAQQKAPHNSLILGNIGNLLSKIDKKREAGIFYKKVVRLNNDAEMVETAKKRLQVLEQN
jgi:tetratricopeptide (TPR) repeat protein